MIKKVIEIIQRILRYIQRDLWHVRASDLKGRRLFGIQTLRLTILSFREFNKDKCRLRASALTYFTVLSLVPIAAMMFGIAQGFGFADKLKDALIEKAEGQSWEEAIMYIINFANKMLEQTRGGVIAGIGVIILIYTVIRVMGNIETSFNEVWGVKKGRSFIRKITDYLAILLAGPIALVMSGSITVILQSQVDVVIEKISVLGSVAPVLYFLIKLVPLLVISGFFVFMYMAVPTTKVKFRSALLGGLVAGLLFTIAQLVYVKFQIGAGSKGAVYGSFAALPLFLIWLQMSWMIMLFGAEVSFAHQNLDTYEFEPGYKNVSPWRRKLLALGIVRECALAFRDGEGAMPEEELVERFDAPVRLLRDVLYELTKAGVLSEVVPAGGVGGGHGPVYQPAMNLDRLTTAEIIMRLEQVGDGKPEFTLPHEDEQLRRQLDGLLEAMKASPSNTPIAN